MTYSDAIEKVMLDNGGFAPLKLIYKDIVKYRIKTGKTPDNTIQGLVQTDKRFKKIGLGVYALESKWKNLELLIEEPKNEIEKTERKHAEVQGMLLEIGNNKKPNEVADTYTNDKKWTFQGKNLSSLATLKAVPQFTYEKIISDSVRFFDVIWFNSRGFPNSVFEVEHSTDFRDAIVKFTELQDFKTEFYCIADENRFSKFEKEISKSAFSAIKDRCRFLSYENIINDYENIFRKNYL